jgi:NADPH2:quinone reductase
MKAFVCHELGTPDVLQFEEMPHRELAPGQVRVRMHAAGLNFPDILTIAGKYQHKPALPYTPGIEGVGTVSETGDSVDPSFLGRRLLVHGPGCFAEELITDADRTWPAPAPLDDIKCAAFMVGYATAYHCMLDRGGLQAGETVLVHGATGGMGMAAVELAKLWGATVIATGGSDEKLAVVKQHGADHVLNYSDGFRDRVLELTGGKGADVVYDPVGGDVFDESLRCISWRGRLVIVGFAQGRIPTVPANYALLKGCSIIGARAGEFRRREPAAGQAMGEDLLRLANEGKLVPHVSHVLPLAETLQAMTLMQQRKIVGKAVLSMA